MKGDETPIPNRPPATPEIETSSQDAIDTTMGTESVTEAFRKTDEYQREQARKETLLLQHKACREVEDYINQYLLNTM